MKKKEQKNEMMTLAFLQTKYQQQKQILMKQNTSLSQQLMKELQRSNMSVQKCAKLQLQVNTLLRENQILRGQIDQLLLKKEEEISIADTQGELELLRQQKKLTKQNQQLQQQKIQLQNILQIIYRQKSQLEHQINKYKQNQNILQKQIQNLAFKHKQYKQQSSNQLNQLQDCVKNYEQQIQKLNIKLNQQKKKKRQFQKKITELSIKINQNEQKQQKQRLQQIQNLIKQKDKYHQRNIQFSTKLTLLQAQNKQLEEFIHQLQTNLKDQLKKYQKQKQTNRQYHLQNQKLINQIHQLHNSNKMLKQKQITMENQNYHLINNKSNKNYQNKQGNESGFQKIYQGSCKQLQQSYHTTFQHQGGMRQQRSLQSIKLSTQLNTIQAELSQSKKQQQSLSYELKLAKKDLQNKQYELMQKQQKIRQLKQKAQRIQSQKNRQILLLRKDNSFLKGKQTQLLQKAKELSDYESSMSLKLSFYQRKIKEHLDTIDRKQSIIEKYKLNASLFQEKQRQYEQNFRRLTDDIQNTKGLKQECQRKQHLVKEYKNKIQKYKEEKESLQKEMTKLKNDNGRLKTQKQRVQTQLEIKQREWMNMKNKQQKGQQHKADDTTKQNNRLKQSKMILDNKIKQLKRQKDELSQALQDIRSVIFNKVDEMISKEMSSGSNKKKNNQQYQAAKLLGLKPGDLDQFLNPSSVNSQRLSKQLEQSWHTGNFSDFINTFMHFLQMKTYDN